MQNLNDSRWCLEGALDFKKSVVVAICTNPFTIGRSADCQLRITSHGVSRKHAVILFSDGRLYLNDLGSKNGTGLNSKKIYTTTEIHHGDVLSFGGAEFRVNKGIKRTKLDPETRILGSKTLAGTGKFVGFSQEIEFLSLLQQADIVTYFQPIVSLEEETAVAYEILGRGARQGLPKDPAKLLGIGKKLQKEIELSELFRLKGVQLGASLPQGKTLFLNTHPDEGLEKGLERSLRRIRTIAPQRPIALEIHESAATDVTEMKNLKKLLDELDIELAYDDFGTGQARLNEIAEVPPHYIKFDISLVRNIDKASANKQNMVKKLVDMSNDLGIRNIAEGVETTQEVEMCRQIGFTHAQGYLFGRPAPVSTYL